MAAFSYHPTVGANLRLIIDNSAEFDLAFETNADAGRVGEQLIRRGAIGPRDAPASPEDHEPAAVKILLVTTDTIPGYDIIEVHGDVFSVSMRAINNDVVNTVLAVGSLLTTSVNHATYSRNSRNAARQLLVNEAVTRGGNAVIGMRYTSTSFGNLMHEVVAYGTAVTITKTAGDRTTRSAEPPAFP